MKEQRVATVNLTLSVKFEEKAAKQFTLVKGKKLTDAQLSLLTPRQLDKYTKPVSPKAHKLPYKLSRSEVAFYNANKDNPAMDFALSFCEPAD